MARSSRTFATMTSSPSPAAARWSRSKYVPASIATRARGMRKTWSAHFSSLGSRVCRQLGSGTRDGLRPIKEFRNSLEQGAPRSMERRHSWTLSLPTFKSYAVSWPHPNSKSDSNIGQIRRAWRQSSQRLTICPKLFRLLRISSQSAASGRLGLRVRRRSLPRGQLLQLPNLRRNYDGYETAG